MVAEGQKYLINNCCAIVLAAGRSARMGTPKQLLNYQGETLLQHALNVARRASVQSVMLVMGSDPEFILNQTNTDGVEVIYNGDWSTGMASSILAGINALAGRESPPNGVLLMVCDQPYVSIPLLNELLAAQMDTGKPIAASRYGDVMGVPALFHKSLFNDLATLQDDSGARRIIQQNPDKVALVPFPQGNIDIDTLEDYWKLL